MGKPAVEEESINRQKTFVKVLRIFVTGAAKSPFWSTSRCVCDQTPTRQQVCSLSMLPAVTSVVLPVPVSAKVPATSEYSAYQLGVQRNGWL